VGGILALGLALEIPAAELVRLFAEHGDQIFRQQASAWGYLKARYGSSGLRQLLAQPSIFGELPLGSSRHRVVIPAVNYSTGVPVVFKTPHHPTFLTDHRRRIVDIALATSAAPFYFRRHVLDHNQYVDGGLFANAPGLIALHEAQKFLQTDVASVHLLSIGTMSSLFTVNPAENCDGGILDWGRGHHPVRAAQRLFGLAISVQESLSHQMLRHRLTDARYTQLDDVLSPERASAVALHKTDKAARDVLIGTGQERAKHAVGDGKVTAMLHHRAPPAHFYNGGHNVPPSEKTHAESASNTL